MLGGCEKERWEAGIRGKGLVKTYMLELVGKKWLKKGR